MKNNTSEAWHLLSDVLPYDAKAKGLDRPKNALREYFLLLTAAEQAVEAWRMGNLKKFDSLVGENACQIRAVKLALMFSTLSVNSDEKLKNITRVKEKVSYLLNNGIDYTPISLTNFLKTQEVEVPILPEEIFLLESFILTKIKTAKEATQELPLVFRESTDEKKLREVAPASRVFATELVRVSRENISRKSVEFIQKIADQFCLVNQVMVSRSFSINYRGLQCLPGFWVTQLLMEYSLKNRIPIVLVADQKAQDRNYEVVKEMVIFFESTGAGYVETNNSSLAPNQAA
ncbi:MAG: hypothetical protein ACHQT8_03375, partial [Chlamydiales bacterium]